MKVRLARFAACSAVVAAVTASSLSRADGDQAHGLSYRESATGLGIATAGVGLSARRSTGADVPVATAELVLDGVPAGATVEVAYLYWINFGAGDASVSLEGDAITGALIGTSDQTCWTEPWSTGAVNRVYRADVTDLVADNGSYTIAGFPSGDATTGDTQGAGLVVVFTDPANDERREILLHDGAGTMNPGNSFNPTLTAPALGELVSAQLHVGAGDGQADLADGPMSVSTKLIPYPDGGYWKGEYGSYWDNLLLDVTSEIALNGKGIALDYSYFTDCVVWAYHALVVTTAGGAEPVGGAGAGGMSTGAGGEGETPNGGTGSEPVGEAGQPASGGNRAGVGGDGAVDVDEDGGATSESSAGQAGFDSGAEAKDDGGCGCRTSAPSSTPAGCAALALALAALGRRARRRVTTSRADPC